MKTCLRRGWRLHITAAFAALAVPVALAANMAPVTVIGFNWDVVVENTSAGPPYTTASELNPGENLAFYQSGLPGKTNGLPLSGSFTSAAGDGTVFQFQPCTANNALVLSSDTGVSSGTLTLVTPAVYSRVAVIANSASASATSAGTLTLTFNDGSSFVTTYSAPDWFNKAGEAIGLFAPDGAAIDALTFGAQTSNVSEGRYPDGGALRLFMPTPSPKAANILPPAPTPPSVTSLWFTPTNATSLLLPASNAAAFYRILD